MDGPSTATIRDVAARAGCSLATVSRVANESAPVSPVMRARVVAAARDLGFSLIRSDGARRPVIGVLLPSVTNPVFASVLAGIEQRARADGLSVVMGQSNYRSDQELEVVEALGAERPVGLVATVCDPATSAALAVAARRKLPTVMVYNETDAAGFGSVSVDNRAAVRLLTEHLLGLGHRAILFISGRFASSDRAARRFAGYRDAMLAADLPALPSLQVDFIDGARDIDLTSALARHRPTAIIASNDLLAVTVIASLRRLGLAVPDDVSVAGFDGADLGRHLWPRLTTIAQPSQGMGMLAAAMVLDMATGRAPARHLRADFEPCRGGTTAPPARTAPSLLPDSHRKVLSCD
ncbi:substrate-binding domain-containing protein [Methylobacterium oryzisoli]|uniref:substrate-binding domain-containing protein n=1 Tax=Methylobacterium oryzisoli TaxID=3385502 RepID=UPI003891B046